MKTFLKWFGIATGSFLIILYLAFLFVLPNAVDINKFKPEVQKLATEYAKLDVNFENAKIITTPLLAVGIKADNISVKLPDGSLLAGMDSFKTRLSLPHLLALCVKISCAEIESPTINLEIKDGKQFKLVTLIEEILNDGDDTIEQKLLEAEAQAGAKASGFTLPIRINVPKVVVNNYKAKIDDLKSNHSLTLQGEQLTLGYNGKSFKVNTNAELLSDENKNVNANINLNCFIPPATKLDKEDDPREIVDIAFINPVLLYRDYDIKANIDMDMKIRQRRNTVITKGFINLDNLTLRLSDVQLPKSYAHITTRGTKINLDTNIALKENEAIRITGLTRYGKRAFADLAIKSDKIYFNDIIVLTKAFLDTLRIKNDLNLFKGNGYLIADTQFQTNFKSLKSAGDILIRDAGIVNKKYNLNFMDFNSTIDLDNNTLDIKDTGAKINGSEIKINGSINEKSIADINVYLEKLPLAPLFKSFAPADLKNFCTVTDGKLFADIKIQGALKNAISTIKVGLEDFALTEKSANIKITNKSFEGNFTNNIKSTTGTLTNKNFKLVIPQTTSVITDELATVNLGVKDITIDPTVVSINNSSTITLSGIIENYFTKPNFNLLADGKLVAEGIKQLGGAMAAPFIDAKGVIPVKATILGDAKKQTLEFLAETDNNNYLTPLHITRLAGKNTVIKSTIDFKQNRLKIKDTGLFIKKETPDEKHPEKIITTFEEIIGAEGTITGLTSIPHINLLKVKLNGDLDGSIQGLANSTFKANGHLFSYGNLMAPRFKGNFNIQDLNIPTLYIALKNLGVDFKGDEMETRLNDLNLNGSTLQIDSLISLIPATNIIIKNLDVTSNSVDVDKVMKVAEEGMKLVPQTGVPTSAQPADIPVEIRNGNLDIKYAKTGGIEAYNTTAKMLMKNNVFFVNKLKTHAFEGNLNGDVSMNLITTFITAKLSGSGFDAEKALLGLANMKDTITGTASVDLDVSLKGATYEEQMQTLNGVVDFKLTDGQLGPFGRLENLILAENIRESEFFQTAIGGIINNLLSVNTSHYDELVGHIKLEDGVAILEPITSLGEIMCLNIVGNFDILKNTADLRLRGRLASMVSDMLGPLAALNPINMAKTSTGSAVMNVATLGLYSLFCETVTQEEMDAVPMFSSDASDYNSTKFQVIIRGDVAKPLSLVKSFKWMALQVDMNNANQVVQNLALEEAKNKSKKIFGEQKAAELEAQAGAIKDMVDTGKEIFNSFKGVFGKNNTQQETVNTVEQVTESAE